MPVDFLSDEQARAYARFDGDPTDTELAQFFYLDTKDEALLSGRRGDHNRLGVALHLCTVRYLGTFLSDLRAIPARAVAYVARQVHVADPGACLQRYQEGQMRSDTPSSPPAFEPPPHRGRSVMVGAPHSCGRSCQRQPATRM